MSAEKEEQQRQLGLIFSKMAAIEFEVIKQRPELGTRQLPRRRDHVSRPHSCRLLHYYYIRGGYSI